MSDFVGNYEISERATKKIKVENDECNSNWWSIPDLVLLRVFHLLSTRDILNAGATCRRWLDISNDELLWKHQFQARFRIDPSIALKPGAESWKSEYKRLTANIPFVEAQCLETHTHQVLHVSFSHNGEMFATCSKDGYVIIWNSGHPCTEKYSHNMKRFSWKYTQYSQFNQSDTLLLVSGVHFGSPHSTSGEIAVFTVDDKFKSHLRCRVVNRPYDIFGTWFSDQYLISGNLHWLAHLVSTSVLWLNKANQEIDSEHVPIMCQLYKFYNKNASTVRAVMIAKCPWLNESNDPLAAAPKDTQNLEDDSDGPSTSSGKSSSSSSSSSSTMGNPISHAASLRRSMQENKFYELWAREDQASLNNPNLVAYSSAGLTIRYTDEYRMARRRDLPEQFRLHADISDEDDDDDDDENIDDDYDPDEQLDANDEYDEMDNAIPRYLIFSTGSTTYTPHQVGFKRIRNVTFPKKLDPGPTLRERIAAKKALQEQQHLMPEPDWWNFDAVADRFDQLDKVIDLHGHIIGMALSPDHRYLYVNTRPWPQNYVITNPLEPPPIAQEIDIHVIDLMTLKSVGKMLRAHKAYTPSTECFFIFLDVCDDYVASGAEDKHAYLWDRYYGVSLAKYKHLDVVNCVAFNPNDSEMLVTTSDDYTIKIWRSRAKARNYNINAAEALELKQQH